MGALSIEKRKSRKWMSMVESVGGVGRGRLDKTASSNERIMKPDRDSTLVTNIDRKSGIA